VNARIAQPEGNTTAAMASAPSRPLRSRSIWIGRWPPPPTPRLWTISPGPTSAQLIA